MCGFIVPCALLPHSAQASLGKGSLAFSAKHTKQIPGTSFIATFVFLRLWHRSLLAT